MKGLSFNEAFGLTFFVSLNKLLLFPAYKSTDFEVHRNWLAITHTLPLSKWYYDTTSEWTLDYPPFFAYFECILSSIAYFFDPAMVDINNLNYNNTSVVVFQRTTVVLTDLILAYAAFKCSRLFTGIKARDKQLGLMVLLLVNCGLFIVDHIHFQYNGFLFGILLLSLYHVAAGNILTGAFLFATLLNFKHIFMYIAPAYAVYMLKSYCMSTTKVAVFFKRLITLATVVLSVFIISFLPFIKHIPQIFSRLFPFKRGLTHAYWAPNIWALYNFADKLLLILGKKFNILNINLASSASSSGLVQQVEHAVLPTIHPLFTMIITLISMSPCLLNMFFSSVTDKRQNINQFIRAVVICSLCSFTFGWHVHEKAIIMAILPAVLLAFVGTPIDTSIFFVLQAVGHYSLFPLLFEPFEWVTKFCLATAYNFIAALVFNGLMQRNAGVDPWWLCIVRFYLFVILPLNEIMCTFVYPYTEFGHSHEFLPLMSTSVVSSLGILSCLCACYFQMFTAGAHVQKK